VVDPIQRIKEIDKERASLLDTAKRAALDAANSAITALNSLGFSYRLIERATTPARRTSRKARRGTGKIKNAPCPICQFKTKPPHDARRHRGQKKKRPFTAQELTAMGYAKAA